MTLPLSGPLSLDDMAAEFGIVAPYGLDDFRGLGGAPSTGPLSITDFYGASSFVDVALANPEFTQAIAEVAKGWSFVGPAAYGTWGTSYLEVGSEQFVGSTTAQRVDYPTDIGASYTFRAFVASEFSSGVGGTAAQGQIQATDVQGSLGISQVAVGLWAEFTFTARELLTTLHVRHSGGNGQRDYVRISEIQFIKN